MKTRLSALATSIIVGLVLAVGAASAQAAYSPKKALFGPLSISPTQSIFPVYQSLGVGIYEMKLRWDFVAAIKPKRPRDPGDRAYEWSDEIEYATRAARASGMQVAVTVLGVPDWANGKGGFRRVPNDPRVFASFMAAAAARYPGVRLWRIGDDVNTRALTSPLVPEVRGIPLDEFQQVAPRHYAELLDAAYGVLKAANPKNIVIGGNTVSYGDIAPRNWIHFMVLPNGKPPRMDVYGHTPYGGREPLPGIFPPLGNGLADFADLPLLAGWVDRWLGHPRGKPAMRLFLAKYFLPTDHANAQFDFFVSRDDQAKWISEAYRYARATKRIYALGWETWQDPAPSAAGDEVNGGLLDAAGNPKPGYFAFRDG